LRSINRVQFIDLKNVNSRHQINVQFQLVFSIKKVLVLEYAIEAQTYSIQISYLINSRTLSNIFIVNDIYFVRNTENLKIVTDICHTFCLFVSIVVTLYQQTDDQSMLIFPRIVKTFQLRFPSFRSVCFA
jgi:hypothetical protein